MRLDQYRIAQGGGELRKDRSRGEYLSSYLLNINELQWRNYAV